MKNFKNLLVISALSLFSTLGMAQSPSAIVASNTEVSEAQTEAFAANTAWAGSKFSANISGDVSGSSLFSVGTFYNIAAGTNFAIPVSVNLGFGQTDSLSTAKGVSVGVLPYINVYEQNGLQVTVHGGLTYQMPNIGDLDSGERFKALLGVQASYAATGGLPTVVSLTPAWVRTIGVENSSVTGLEVSVIVPVAPRLGILGEVLVPFSANQVSTGFNIGIVVAGPLNSRI